MKNHLDDAFNITPTEVTVDESDVDVTKFPFIIGNTTRENIDTTFTVETPAAGGGGGGGGNMVALANNAEEQTEICEKITEAGYRAYQTTFGED